MLKRIGRIINEKAGKIVSFKNEAIMLEDVYCQSKYSDRRMFCHRRSHSFWREVWLERAQDPPAGPFVEETDLTQRIR